MSLKQVAIDIDEITDETDRQVLELLERRDVKRATKELRDARRRLRLLRREVVADEREVRRTFQEKRVEVSKSGQVLGLFMGGRGRRMMAAGRGFDRRKLSERLLEATEAHVLLKDLIDERLNRFEVALVDLDGVGTDDSEDSGDPATPYDEDLASDDDDLGVGETNTIRMAPPASPAAWVGDPCGRHELRYWDGQQWTHHVADAGVTATDPV